MNRPVIQPAGSGLAALTLPLALALATLLPAPARADMVIHLTNGQTVKLPYKRSEVAKIEYVGEAATVPGPVESSPAAAGAAPGTAWVVNAQGAIYQRVGGRWERLPGAARAIAAGADGSLWAIGTDNVPGGHGIFRWSGTDWSRIDGGAVSIAVAPDGQPWVIDARGTILRRNGGRWQALPGAAKDIGIGADGTVWVIGLDATAGGYGIHRWSGNQWSRVDGAGVRVAVTPDGQPWVVNSTGQIWRRSGGQWQLLPGQATDIGVGSDGSAWIIGQDAAGGGFGIHQWNGTQWTRVDGSAVAIAVR
jgi:Tectonin domain